MKKLISLSRQTRRLCLRFSKRISKLALRNAEAGGISTTDLVNKIYTFCEVYSGITLYKYQTQFSKRIIRSVLENDGAELTALFARQSGKTETISVTVGGLMIILPQLANMPMFADDKRLTAYKVGFWVGIFAPNLRQSQITFRRMKSRMQSKEALAVLNDPEFRLEYSTSNGQTVALSNGSYVTAISASDGSSIEGETFMFIIIEECQDVSNYKIRKSIHPMGAAYNSTICKIGTPTTFKGDFYETIERNKKEFKEGKLRVRNHFEYDYKVVEKYNPKYAKYVEREKRSLGESSDEFQMSYCVAPDTLILTSDLRWVRADQISCGDKLVGFDEEKPKRYGQRKFRESIVEDVGRITRPCYKVTLSDGGSVVCSSEHQWLVFTAGSRTQWKMTKDLVPTDRIYRVCNVWDDLPNDYRLGYLSASFDGEGCLTQFGDYIRQITFAQRDNVMLKTVKEYLTDFGFDYSAEYFDKRKIKMGQDPVYKLFIKGGKRELLRFLGSVRPKRLLDKLDPNKLGTVRCANGELGDSVHPYVSNLEYIGEHEVIPIRTSTRTFVANGLASHNCLKWVISRGMFVDILKFERDCGDELLDLVSSDLFSDHVAGIDIGGGSSSNSQEADSTVITIVEVDWDSPVILEHTTDEETNEDIVYEAYNTYVKAWIEISPEVARDYNEQYEMIMEVLSRFKIRKAFIDATREASLAQRVAANVKFPVVPFVFSTKSKSEMYKNLDREINSARLHFPASKEAKDTKEYDKFIFQFANLQKGYSGSNMIVSHPAERGAHDDYCDSLALAILASRERGQIDETETQSRNDVFRGQTQSSRYGMRNSRNILTARRRA